MTARNFQWRQLRDHARWIDTLLAGNASLAAVLLGAGVIIGERAFIFALRSFHDLAAMSFVKSFALQDFVPKIADLVRHAGGVLNIGNLAWIEPARGADHLDVAVKYGHIARPSIWRIEHASIGLARIHVLAGDLLELLAQLLLGLECLCADTRRELCLAGRPGAAGHTAAAERAHPPWQAWRRGWWRQCARARWRHRGRPTA